MTKSYVVTYAGMSFSEPEYGCPVETKVIAQTLEAARAYIEENDENGGDDAAEEDKLRFITVAEYEAEYDAGLIDMNAVLVGISGGSDVWAIVEADVL